MYSIELFLNKRLADIDKSSTIRLNRQLINPSELNTKDAQNSFSITLPVTGNNDIIFKYASIEETRNKFNEVVDAELIVNGDRIFKGLFKLYEVTSKIYKGNLYKPATKEVKDIFADIALPDNPPYTLPFADFAPSISAINTAAQTVPQAAIFPYVLYGLLPKSSADLEGNTYTARDLWDNTVRYGMADFAPSMNVLKLIKHLFNSNGYNLQGSAFTDTVLANVYQSYRNTPEFRQPWNWGRHGAIKVIGSWGSNRNKKSGNSVQLERGVFQSNTGSAEVYNADLLQAMNTSFNVVNDPGKNTINRQVNDQNGAQWTQAQIMVPATGFYKVRFMANLNVDPFYAYRSTDPITGVRHISGVTDHARNDLLNSIFEIKLLRDRKTGDFGLDNGSVDGTLYRDNLPQNSEFTQENAPKYFPKTTFNGYLNLIDPYKNKNHVLGFMFGASSEWIQGEYQNITGNNTLYAQMQAAKSGNSWNLSETTTSNLVINNPGYMKWGVLGTFDNPGDNPNTNIDYSGGARFNNRALDGNGNLGAVNTGYMVLNRFAIQKNYTYIINGGSGWTGNVYVHLGAETLPYLVVPIVNGVATFSTAGISISQPNPQITMYLRTPAGDVDGSLVISRIIDEASAGVLGLEDTNKFKIQLTGAPTNYARRGQSFGASADPLWDAQGELNAVVWLEAGELITVASSSYRGRYRQSGMHTQLGWINHNIYFDLELTPFRTDMEWSKLDLSGKSTAPMSYVSAPNFLTNQIDLIKFLPADVKTNDYVENVLKAFNLKLSPVSDNTYSLDVKQAVKSQSNRYVDLDSITSIEDRVNTSLGLPYAYKIGFTNNADEEGLFLTGDNGGGEFKTGAIDGDTIEQKSSFSYNWFKNITKTETAGNVALSLPIISKHEAWVISTPYLNAMSKRYTDLPFRFWFPNGLLSGSFNFNGAALSVARVSNSLGSSAVLNYKNIANSIMRRYYTLLINVSSHFTTVEAYLSAYHYTQLNGDYLVRINGDLYYLAETTGYDPTGRNITSLKLIRSYE